MFTTVKEHMGIVKGLEGLGWQEILGFSNQELLPFTKAIDTDEKRSILKQLPIEYGKKLVVYPEFLSKIIICKSRNFSLQNRKFYRWCRGKTTGLFL